MLSRMNLYPLIGIYVENFNIEAQRGLSCESVPVYQFLEQSTIYIY
jgi:hypothetical protein